MEIASQMKKNQNLDQNLATKKNKKINLVRKMTEMDLLHGVTRGADRAIDLVQNLSTFGC